MKAWVPALVVVMLGGLGPFAAATHVTGPVEATPLNCGSLSPLDNTCEVVNDQPMSAHPAPSFFVLGFVGTIEISLKQAQSGGSLHWRCSFPGFDWRDTNPALASSTCTTERRGPLVIPAEPNGRGPPVTMRCVASGFEYGGVPVVPDPFGPWGCAVTL